MDYEVEDVAEDLEVCQTNTWSEAIRQLHKEDAVDRRKCRKLKILCSVHNERR